jgi:hypothetical protein
MPECYTCGKDKGEKLFDRLPELDGARSVNCRSCTTRRYAKRSKEIANEYPALRGAKTTKLPLSEFDIREIIQRNSEGESIRSISRDIGVSKSSVSRIVNGKRT